MVLRSDPRRPPAPQFSSSVSALINEKERELRSFNDYRITALEEAAQEVVCINWCDHARAVS